MISAEGEREVVTALQVAAKELGSSPYALQLRYINTLHNMVASPTTANAGFGASTHTTVMFPVPMEMAETLTPQFLQQLAQLFPKPPATESTNNAVTPLPTAQVSHKSSAGPVAAAGGAHYSKHRSSQKPSHIDLPDESARAAQSPSPPPPPPPPVPPSPSDTPESSHSEPEIDRQRAKAQQQVSYNSEQVSRRSSRKRAQALGVPIERAGTLPTIPSPSSSHPHHTHEPHASTSAAAVPHQQPPPQALQPLRVLTEMPPTRHESHHYQNFAPPLVASAAAPPASHFVQPGENGQSRAPQPSRPLPVSDLRHLLPNEFLSVASGQPIGAGSTNALLTGVSMRAQQLVGGSHGEGEYAVPFALQTGHSSLGGMHLANARPPTSAVDTGKSLSFVLRPLPSQIPEGLLVDLSAVAAPSQETAM